MGLTSQMTESIQSTVAIKQPQKSVREPRMSTSVVEFRESDLEFELMDHDIMT
jgi:hypothetical protein